MSRIGNVLRRAATVAVAAAVALPAFAPAPATAFSTASAIRVDAVEARLLTLINQARVARGLGALALAPGYTDIARRWAANQASRNVLEHNPNLVRAVETTGGSHWGAIAENVGRAHGTQADALFNSYMNSTGHRANILSPKYRYIGLGWAEHPDGYGYNTQVFVDAYSTSYGRTREPAYGGAADRRTVTATSTLAHFETGWDQRLSTGIHGTGLWAGALTVEAPGSGDQGARYTARETTAGRGGQVELRLRDAVDLSRARALNVRLAAWTGSGRAVRVDVVARTEFGGTVWIGATTVGTSTRTVSLTLPSAARNFRNQITLYVSRASLQAISPTQSRRWATVAVKDLTVVV